MKKLKASADTFAACLRFDTAYRILSFQGRADSLDSCEYRRVWNEFVIAGCPADERAFIIEHANGSPFSSSNQ